MDVNWVTDSGSQSTVFGKQILKPIVGLFKDNTQYFNGQTLAPNHMFSFGHILLPNPGSVNLPTMGLLTDNLETVYRRILAPYQGFLMDKFRKPFLGLLTGKFWRPIADYLDDKLIIADYLDDK